MLVGTLLNRGPAARRAEVVRNERNADAMVEGERAKKV